MNFTFLLFSFILFASSAFGRYLQCLDPSKKLLGMKRLSNADKMLLVAVHNKLRNFVAAGKQSSQPPAENMLQMSWDEDAANQAFNWAGGCAFQHNKPKDSRTGAPMGQNLYIKMTTDRRQTLDSSFKSVSDMIRAWYDEVKAYSFGNGFHPSTGHYTQLIWANSGKLGCGFSYFLENNKWISSYLVCNYSPSGNYIGQLPYKAGKVNCKKNNLLPSSVYSHLCVKK